MKTKKLFAAILAATACVGAMSGCAGESTDTTNAESEFVMMHYEYIKGANDVQVYVHRETRVMYMYVMDANSGGLTVMLGSDGKPLLYEGELE